MARRGGSGGWVKVGKEGRVQDSCNSVINKFKKEKLKVFNYNKKSHGRMGSCMEMDVWKAEFL